MMHISWHFDLGNSSRGPIGASGRVCGKTKNAAVRRARQLIEDNIDVWDAVEIIADNHEYLTVYFNPDKLTARHLNDPEDCNCTDEEGL